MTPTNVEAVLALAIDDLDFTDDFKAFTGYHRIYTIGDFVAISLVVYQHMEFIKMHYFLEITNFLDDRGMMYLLKHD